MDTLQQTSQKPKILSWLFLLLAIVLEVGGVILLEFIPTWLTPYVTTNDKILIANFEITTSTIAKINLLVMIAISYYCMSLALRQIALGVAYSIWEIVGLIAILFVSFVFLEHSFTLQEYCGIAVGFIGIICIILGEEH